MKRGAAAAGAEAPPSKKQASLAAMFGAARPASAQSTSSSSPSAAPPAAAVLPVLPHPLARHWAGFPLGGPCGTGRGVVPTPPPFVPPSGAQRLPFQLEPGHWYDTRSHPVLSTTPFIVLAGRSAAAPPDPVAAHTPLASLPPGNDVSLAATRRQRAAALADMTPATLGACCFAHFLPPEGAPAASSSSASSAPESAAAAAVAPPPLASSPADGVLRVAALDLDGTLIKPADPKARFCSKKDDWLAAYPAALTRATALARAGYELVVMTNQAGVAKGHTTLAIVQARCAAVAAALGVPVTIMVAPGDLDFYRKPAQGMWWLFEAVVWPALHAWRARQAATTIATTQAAAALPLHAQRCPPVCLAESVYIGDAAGRLKPEKASPSPRKGRDHSAGDLAFALGAGLRFATPEAVFAASQDRDDRLPLGPSGGKPSNSSGSSSGSSSSSSISAEAARKHPLGDWLACRDMPPPLLQAARPHGGGGEEGGGDDVSSPSQLPRAWHAAAATATAADGAPVATPELVLLVGPPGTGKSSFAAHAFPLAGAAPGPHDSEAQGRATPTAAAAAAPPPSAVSHGGRRLYERVNQDRLGSRDKAMAAASAAIARGHSVMVDATNVDAPVRKEWVALGARLGGIPVRAVLCGGGKGLSFHLVGLRTVSPLGGVDGVADRRSVPSMVVHSLHNKLVAPVAASEGLSRVDVLPFTPGPFLVDEGVLAGLEGAAAAASLPAASAPPDDSNAPAAAAHERPGGDDGGADPSGLLSQSLERRVLAASANHAACPVRLDRAHVAFYAEALALELVYATVINA